MDQGGSNRPPAGGFGAPPPPGQVHAPPPVVAQQVPWAQQPPSPGMEYVVPVNVAPLAIIAGYIGLLSMMCIPAPLALAVGILALRDLKKNPGRSGAGRAWFAIVMGAIGTVIILGSLVSSVVLGGRH